MKVVFDTDVLIDFLFDKEPFAGDAAKLLSAVERGDLQGYVCATSITTIFYLSRKAVGNPQARRYLDALLSLLEVAPVSRGLVEAALISGIADFEDAVVAAAAAQVSADFIVTRNLKDFKKSPVAALSPAALLALFDSASVKPRTR